MLRFRNIALHITNGKGNFFLFLYPDKPVFILSKIFLRETKRLLFPIILVIENF